MSIDVKAVVSGLNLKRTVLLFGAGASIGIWLNERGKMKSFLLVSALALAWTTTVAAQDDKEFIITKTEVNIANKARNPAALVAQCADQAVCGVVLGAAAAYAGIPPEAMVAATAISSIYNRGSNEEYYGHIVLPDGYKFCSVTVHTLYAVPQSGERDPYLSVDAYHSGVAYYAWVDTPKPFQGGSSLGLEFTVVGVRPDVTDKYVKAGKCRPEGVTGGAVKAFDCRGGGSHGKQKCGVHQY